MAAFSLTVKMAGAKPIKRSLDTLASKSTSIFKTTTKEALTLITTELARYPDQRSGSKYKRTFNLQRGWQQAPGNMSFGTTSGSFAFAGVTNNGAKSSNGKAYASYVQGGTTSFGGQAKTHQGIWPTDTDIVEGQQDAIKKLYEDALTQLIAKAHLS